MPVKTPMITLLKFMISCILRVVTGLRFVRVKGILHIQVKQGRLLENRQIDRSSQKWMRLLKNGEVAPLSMTNNKFYLDDVTLPPEHVVIGEWYAWSVGKMVVRPTISIILTLRGIFCLVIIRYTREKEYRKGKTWCLVRDILGEKWYESDTWFLWNI